MPIATVRQLCAPSAVVASDSLVEQVEQVETLAAGGIDGRQFFRRNFFTTGLDLLVRRDVLHFGPGASGVFASGTACATERVIAWKLALQVLERIYALPDRFTNPVRRDPLWPVTLGGRRVPPYLSP